MDHSKASKSFHDNPANRLEAEALKSRVQSALVEELVDELRGDPSGEELSHHLGLPEDGDLRTNLLAWCSDPDSTVFVLHSVLLSIGREDLANKLLRKMQSMPLCIVIIEDDTSELVGGPAKSTGMTSRQGCMRFERVMTSCDRDLGSALRDALGIDLSCYQIVGPGDWVSWFTKAEQLKGKQITLQQTNGLKRKNDHSNYNCNRYSEDDDKKGYIDKSKVCHPSGFERSGDCSNQPGLHASDKRLRRMSVDSDDVDVTVVKRPNTLPFGLNILSDEDGSPLIDIQKPPLDLTPSPLPTSTDTSNMTPMNNPSTLCVTPDTDDSLDGHRSSYPVITTPSVASVDELEEYDIDENTDKKVPINNFPSGTSFRMSNTTSHSTDGHSTHLKNLPRSSSDHLLPSYNKPTVPAISPAGSCMMDSVENVNEILDEFPNPHFNNNASNALNNLNSSSSQTNLKQSLQSRESNHSDPNVNIKHDVTHRDTDQGNDQTMEVDSVGSSNTTPTKTQGVTRDLATTGNGSSSSGATLTDDSVGHQARPPFEGMSPSEYVPHRFVRQMTDNAEFAECSSQRNLLPGNYRDNSVHINSISSNESSIDASRSNSLGVSYPKYCPTGTGNRMLNDLSSSDNATVLAAATAAALAIESPPTQRQPFFIPPPPPPYAPPSYQQELQQQQPQQYNQQQDVLAQQHVLQQNPHQHVPLHPQQSQSQLQQQQGFAMKMTPGDPIQPRAHPKTQTGIFVHTPLSSEDFTASDSEPPPYRDIVERNEDMQTEIHNENDSQNIHHVNNQHHTSTGNHNILYYPTSAPFNNDTPPHLQRQMGNPGAHTSNFPVDLQSLSRISHTGNIITPPENNQRRVPPINSGYVNTDFRLNEMRQYQPQISGAHTRHASPVMADRRPNELQQMKIDPFKNDNDPYLTVCDPPYTNTAINNKPQLGAVSLQATSKSLPPAQSQPHRPPRQQHYIHPPRQQRHQQTNPIYNSGSVISSDEGSTTYNYIDGAGVYNAMVAAAARGTVGGGTASQSLPHDNTVRSPNTEQSQSRLPNMPTLPTPNRLSIEEQLAKVEGWMQHETDLTIEGTMEDYRHENGNFIVWRSQEKNGYIITVSHNRMLNHFHVVEERIDNSNRFIYYVFKRGYRSESFLDLVNHYIQCGIRQPKVDPRMGDNKVYEVVHIRLRRPLKVKIVRTRKT